MIEIVCSFRARLSRAPQFLALPILVFFCPGSHKSNLAFGQIPPSVRSFANAELLEFFDPALGDSDAFAGEVNDEFSFSDEKCEIPQTYVRVPYRWIVWEEESDRELVVGLWGVVGHVNYAVGAQIFPFCGVLCELRSPMVLGSTLEPEQLVQVQKFSLPPLQSGEYTVTLFVSALNAFEDCGTSVQHNLSLGVLTVPHGQQKPLICICSFQKTGTNLIRYFVETLSGAPTAAPLISGAPPLLGRYFKNFLYLAPGWVRFQHGIHGDCLHAEKLIITMRNPLEVILRHSRDLYATEGLENTVSGLEELIRQFHAFPRTKLVVRFEDAIGSETAKVRKVLLGIAEMLELEDVEATVSTYEKHLAKHRELSRRMYPFKLHNTTSPRHHSGKASVWELQLAKDAIRQSALLREILAAFYHDAEDVAESSRDGSSAVEGIPVVDCRGQQLPTRWDAIIRPWTRAGHREDLPSLVVVMAGRLDEPAQRITWHNVARMKELHAGAGLVVAAGGLTAQSEAATLAVLQGLRAGGVGVLIYSEASCGAMEPGGFAAAVHAGVRAATVVMMQTNMWVERRLPELRCGFVPLWHFNAHFFNKFLLDDPEAFTEHTHAWVVEQADALGLEVDAVFRAGGAADECGVFGGAYALSSVALDDMLTRGLFHLEIPSKLHAMMMERVLALGMRTQGCNPCDDAIDGDIYEVWDAMPGFSHEFAPHMHLGKYFGSRRVPARGFWSDKEEVGSANGRGSRVVEAAQDAHPESSNGKVTIVQRGQHGQTDDAAEVCFPEVL